MSPANSRKRAAPSRRGLTLRKKKRRPSAAASASCTTTATTADDSELRPPWATLDEDLVRVIAGRVLAGDVTDYLRFRAVCRQWRSSTECPRGRSVVDPRFHPRHWTMLPEGFNLYPGHTRLRGRVRFLNLRTGALASVHTPLFKNHFAMDYVDGLLLLHRDHDMAVRLLHPFTGDVVELPSLATLRPQLYALFAHDPVERAYTKEIEFLQFMRKIVAAVSFSPDDGVVTAMLALDTERVRRVAFSTSEDRKWTLSDWETQDNRISILPFQGKLYFLTTRSQIWVVDPPQRAVTGSSSSSSSLLMPPRMIAAVPMNKLRIPMYMAECDSEILLVSTTARSRWQVRVHRLADLVRGRLIPLRSIGGNSLFVLQRSICVSSEAHPTIAGDSVVILHPSFKYLGEYHLRSRTWSQATDGNYLGEEPVPSPYTLVHHIYSCCHRYYWRNVLPRKIPHVGEEIQMASRGLKDIGFPLLHPCHFRAEVTAKCH
ncbi:hypothetical protein EJB05_32327, partial [Eragrostis curvula]